MTSRSEFEATLAAEPESPRRILTLGALLGTEIGSEVIVVGGSAIEVYTQGGYASGDVDIVGKRRKIIATLKEWGFREGGRLFIHDRLKLVVDAVGEYYTGSLDRTKEIVTAQGRVRLAGLEDLIIKRLIRIKHGREHDRIKETLNLAIAFWGDLDMPYLAELAEIEQVSDIWNDLRKQVQSVVDRSGGL